MNIQPLIAVDQFVNSVTYIYGDGFGMADETISARLFRCYVQGLISDRWYKAIDILFWFDPQHCYTSWRSEVERRQLPGIYSIEGTQ